MSDEPSGTALKAAIAVEFYRALEHLGAKSDLLAIVGSWRDTRSEEWTLEQLRRYNENPS